MPQQVRIGWRSGSSSQTAASIVTSGLVLNLDAGNVSSYSGTGTTWTDLSSTGNNGTLVNGVGYSSVNGGVMTFDGVNDYVNIANKARINNTDFTYDFWFKVNSNPNTYQTIMSQIGGDYVNYSVLGKNRSGIAQGNIYFQLQGFTLQSNLSGTDLITVGNINYTAIAKKEGIYYKLYLYRNGVLDNSLNTTLTSIDMTLWNNFNTNIGRTSAANGAYGDYLVGNIYVTRMYNKALSASEITQNFDATKTRFGYSNLDTDAQAFLTAASIMDSTQASAVNTLVTSLKSANIWTKMKALYPFVGGNATSHKFNLKDPRDVDAAFRLQFNGGWVHSSTGALPNGTTGWATTYFNPVTQLTTQSSNHLAIYLRTNINEPAVDMGSFAGYVGLGYDIESRYSNVLYSFNGIQNDYVSFANTDSRGLFINTRTSNNVHKILINGVVRGTNTNNFLVFPNTNIALATRYNVSTSLPQSYSSKEQAFASIGDGLSDAEAANFYTAVQTFQSTLGRQVGIPIVADTDAQAFLNAAVITDSTQASAITTLVTDLKSANIWTKMKALYPFVGGNATSHKFNLKDPRDVDAAFRLIFSGGWTHTSTGALPNGTNAWANTYFSEYSHITNADTQLSNFSHASIYSRTNSPSINQYGGIGVDNSHDVYGNFVISSKRADGLSYGYSRGTLFTTPTTMPDSRGLFLINRQSNSLLKYSRNNSLISQNTNNLQHGASRISFYLGAINNWGSAAYFDNKEHSLVTLGYSLTDAESTAFYTAVQAFQTALGRQV